MKSKITILGHPIHPMLIAFPITFYFVTFFGYCFYNTLHDAFWFRVAYAANIVGVASAVVAAIPGFLDWLLAIPNRDAAKFTGLYHMILNLLALGFFGVNAWAQAGQWFSVIPNASGAIPLSLGGVLCTLGAGFLGWNLVQKHHIGIDLTTEQAKLEPAEPIKEFAKQKDKMAS